MWIEIDKVKKGDIVYKSLSTRRVWIEIVSKLGGHLYYSSSLSTRRVWIEIFSAADTGDVQSVTLHTESVD